MDIFIFKNIIDIIKMPRAIETIEVHPEDEKGEKSQEVEILKFEDIFLYFQFFAPIWRGCEYDSTNKLLI